MIIRGFIYLFLLISLNLTAQNFTKKDSLQGGFSKERMCFDVKQYNLNITLNIEKKQIIGYNEITFEPLENTEKIQLDLFENMQIDSIVFQDKKLNYKREFNAVFINFPTILEPKTTQKLVFYYNGNPQIAKNAPWDGGFVFKHDSNGKPWVGVAVQGTGPSLWYPVKEGQTDEPDLGAKISVAVPNGLMNVSNGKFIGSEDLKNGYTRWNWEVKNPINNYNITLNVANYSEIKDKIDDLNITYYVLKENTSKAKKHFEEIKTMMNCYQTKFGVYPFIEDGYKLVETPYLGMEHQSAVAYGNQYKKGYLGNDVSGTGEGLFFDFVVIHETAHEWFGNSITSKDIADMWIHEGFTTYAESVYIECVKGYETAQKYINGQGKRVMNDRPIIGKFGVNNKGSVDMYNKGAMLINTIRHIVNNDQQWWEILYKFSTTFKHKIIDTQTVITFFETETKQKLASIFDQYLNYKNIPKLDLQLTDNNLYFKWTADVQSFEMPVEITIKGKLLRLKPTTTWKRLPVSIQSIDEINIHQQKFYIKVTK